MTELKITVTINGGAGADRISLENNSENVVIQYASGDGKDSIWGFNETDSIEITSGEVRTSVQSGTNAIFYIGSGTSNAITFKDSSILDFAVEDNMIVYSDGGNLYIEGTSKAETLENEFSFNKRRRGY